MTTQRVPYGFIVGSGFSGSTLVAMALGTHPEITTIAEMGPAADWAGVGLACSCGETIATCPHFRRIEARVGYDISVDAGSLRFLRARNKVGQRLLTGHLGHYLADRIRDRAVSVLARSTIEKTQQRTLAFVRAILLETGASVYVDATKSPHHLEALLRVRELNVRAIHLVRDPRGFVASAVKNLGSPVRRAAKAWVREQRRVELLRRRYPALLWKRVRYEDFCAAPQAVIAELHQLLTVRPRQLDRVLYPSKQHLIGNRVRLKSELQIRLDERWREDLEVCHQAVVERIAWPLAGELGYSK